MVNREVLDHRAAPQLQPTANFRILLVSVLAAIIGLAAGVVAYVLLKLITLLSNLFFFQRVSWGEIPTLVDNPLGFGLILVTTAGGLIAGLMAKYGSSKIRGHGIPESMEAVLFNRSRISPRVACLKPISAALAIGTGHPFGAEGPIIQTGGALGSLIGQLVQTTSAERKVLLGSGAAAGMAAIFNTPIAAVILAIELLLFEFRARSFIPLVIASTLATSVHFILLGRAPLFIIGQVDFGIPGQLPFYLVLGVVVGLAAAGLSKSLYWFEDMYERLPLDRMWWPVIGGVILGIIGLFVPRVLGVGYGTIGDILNNRLPLTLLLMILVFKLIAMLFTLGAGTSGGLLAPTFMVSAALGAIYAVLINQIIPGAELDPQAYAIVSMASVFGAASRSTFTFIIFAFELTRDYNAILPLMLVGVIADGIALLLMRNSIMTEKLERRGIHVHQEFETDILQRVEVGEVMVTDVSRVEGSMKVQELADKLASDPIISRYQALPIVNKEGRLKGIITRGDVMRALQNSPRADIMVSEAGSDSLVVAYPNELLHSAVNRMVQHDIGRVLVVDPRDPQKLVGYLGRSAVLAARKRRLQEESVREPGWVENMLFKRKDGP